MAKFAEKQRLERFEKKENNLTVSSPKTIPLSPKTQKTILSREPTLKNLKGNSLASKLKTGLFASEKKSVNTATGGEDLNLTQNTLKALKTLPISIELHMELNKAKLISSAEMKRLEKPKKIGHGQDHQIGAAKNKISKMI